MRISDWSSDVCSSDLLDQRREGCKPDEAVELRDDRLMSLNIVAEHRGELARHVGREFEQDDAAAAAAADRGAEQAHQILGFFLDLDVAVANDAEDAARADREARKERSEEQTSEIFDRHEVRGFPRPR